MAVTSPENIRKRQYRLGIAMVVLGCLTVVWGIVLEVQNQQQRHCLQDSLAQLNNAFTVRAQLNDQRNEIITEKSALTDQQVSAQRQLVKDISTATTNTEVAAAFAKFSQTDQELTKESATVAKHLADVNEQIKTTKIPAFPEGKCG